MKKYDYTVVWARDENEFANQLNRMGNSGFRFVETFSHHYGLGAVMEREREED